MWIIKINKFAQSRYKLKEKVFGSLVGTES